MNEIVNDVVENITTPVINKAVYAAFAISLIVFFSPFILIINFFDLKSDIYHGGQIFQNGIVFSAATAVLSRVLIRVVFVSGFFRIIFRSVFRSAFRVLGRVSLRLAGGKQGKMITSSMTKNITGEKDKKAQSTSKDVLSVVLSWITMGISFLFVYWIVWDAISIEGIIGIGVCLIFLYTSELLYCKYTETEYDFSITKEGILIQTLFSFSLSFLPLVYDTNNHDGNDSQKAKMGIIGITTLSVLGITFSILSNIFHLHILFAISQIAFLFVMMLSFPIKPLEGGDIFAWKKGPGILIFLVALFGSSFLLSEEFISII